MHRSAQASFALDFTETSHEAVIVVYLSEPSIVIRPRGNEKTEQDKRERGKSKKGSVYQRTKTGG